MLLVCQIRLDVDVVVVVVVEECGVRSAQASGLSDALVRGKKVSLSEMCGLLSYAEVHFLKTQHVHLLSSFCLLP